MDNTRLTNCDSDRYYITVEKHTWWGCERNRVSATRRQCEAASENDEQRQSRAATEAANETGGQLVLYSQLTTARSLFRWLSLSLTLPPGDRGSMIGAVR